MSTLRSSGKRAITNTSGSLATMFVNYRKDASVQHREHPPPLSAFAREEGLSLLKNFQTGRGVGLTGSSFLKGVARKEEGDLFQGGLQILFKK